MVGWACIALAGAQDSEPPAPKPSVRVIEVERRYVLPPFRLGLRAVLRSDLNVGPLVEFGLLLWSNDRFKLDANVSTASQGVAVPGPQRNMNHWDLGLDLLTTISKGFELGPTAAVSHRVFRQQGLTQARFIVPVVGARASVPVLHHRKWSWTTDVRVMVDLALTRLVFETQELRDLSPIQVQLGQRFHLGHGRRARGDQETR